MEFYRDNLIHKRQMSYIHSHYMQWNKKYHKFRKEKWRLNILIVNPKICNSVLCGSIEASQGQMKGSMSMLPPNIGAGSLWSIG